MDGNVVLMIAVPVAILLFSLILLFSFRKKPSEEKAPARPVPNRVREGVPRRVQVARNRGGRLRAQAGQHQNPVEQDSDPENEEPAEDTSELDKLGAKKRAKLEAKAEKKAQREASEQQRQEKKKQDQQAEDTRRKEEEKTQAEEKLKEEEERKVREEKERKDHEEYLAMKQAFSVEEEGFEDGDDDNEENLLQNFVNHIKTQKVVVIEDLAAQFKLKTQSAIDRIKDLQSDEILTGVIDDRGKFIYVSQVEMDAVAKFIKQRGRVSIAELAENSNQLINLTPSAVVG